MDNKFLNLQLEEYKFLREELLHSRSSRNSITNFGLATIGVFSIAGVTAMDKNIVFSYYIFALFLPIVCCLVLAIWFGEVERTMLISHYCADLEKNINNTISSDSVMHALKWENWLRDNKDEIGMIRNLKYAYIASIALYILLAFSSYVTSQFIPYSAGLMKFILKITIPVLIFSNSIWIFIRSLNCKFKKNIFER